MSKTQLAALMTGASLSILASQAWAQTDAAAPAGEETVGEVVVTGTRIVRDGYTAPTPVTVAPLAEMVKTTPTNIPDALNKLPQFQNSFSPARSTHNFANSAENGNVLNLRALGGSRTLILFDGQRVPPTTFKGTVDTNVLPNLLVSRVEIVTGGASAAYGSDAVSGVVNFILDRNFKGVKGVAQAGVSQRGDNHNQRFGLAAGADFADGKGHLLLSGEYFHNDGMLRSDRKIGSISYSFVGSNPACIGVAGAACLPGGANNPYTIGTNVRLTAASEFGKITAGPPGFVNTRLTADGQIVPFAPGAPTGTPGFAIGGDGYTIAADTVAVAPLKTYQTYGRVSYDVAPDVNAYLQASFTRSDLSYVSLANSLVPPTFATLFSGNPYLPASIQSALTASGLPSISVARYGASSPKPKTKERTDFWEVTAGLEGKLGDWNWDAAYNHARSKYDVAQRGVWDWKKTYAALDAVRDASGNIVCRVLTNPAVAAQYQGCQPLNILISGSAYASQPGYAYAVGTSSYQAVNVQDSVAFNVHGSLFHLPAGSVDVAVGAEYRHQKLDLDSNADPALLDTAAERDAYFAGLRAVPNGTLAYWLTNVGVAHGKESVKEAYGEVAVPLIADAPFAKELSLNGAARITDYSTSGRVTTWKAGATWRPIDDLLLRGTLSRDIRAPNLYELFAGDQSAIGLLNDPVSGANTNVNQVSSGNPDLKPEIGKTFTVGGVLTPHFIPGFSISVDYYKVRISKAITTLSLAQIVNNCFANAAAPECALITRPTPTSFPSLVRVAPANIAFLQTKGIDFDASYRRDVGPGNLALRLYATRLIQYESQQSATAPLLQYAGISQVGSGPIGYPKWRATLTADYSWDKLGVTVSEQFINKMRLGIPGSPQSFVDPSVPSVWYTDLSVRYDIKPGGRDVQLFATINNLFDKDPPLIPGTIPGVNLPTNLSTYDIIGRAYTAGVRFKF
jgi:outer membrane receptor protein involved in Fe transport